MVNGKWKQMHYILHLLTATLMVSIVSLGPDMVAMEKQLRGKHEDGCSSVLENRCRCHPRMCGQGDAARDLSSVNG